MKQRIRVLQVRETPQTKCGGIDANCRAIESEFASDSDIQILPIIDFRIHNINILRRGYIAIRDVNRAIEEFAPDIVHIHGSYTFSVLNSICSAIKYKKKIVYSPHFHPFYSLKRPIGGKIFFYFFIRPFIRFVNTIITINSEDTQWFQKFHNNVIKIPHWSNTHISSSTSIRKKDNMILFVGRINDSVKGIEHIYALPEGVYDIHCVGKGDLLKRSDITQHIDITNDELLNLYKQASLLVVPSRYEAFSYVSVEALSCNTPIVTSDRVRIADYFLGCKYVRTFKYGDLNEFSKAVKETIGQSVDLNYITDVFDRRKLRELYKDVYLNC
ncbi:MAG: glycosyltransferase family 4 protein [Rikenellaceae bacterium]|nr:glycosyltransferase family 4 protein [Rikenellaceae bacterium]